VRTRSSSEEARKEATELLCRRVLQAVCTLHDEEARILAQKTLGQLAEGDPERLETLRREWMDFLASYDAGFLQKLSLFGTVDPDDLRGSIEKFEIPESPDPESLSRIARLLSVSLSPSIASGIDDELADFAQMLENDPGFLVSAALEEEFMGALKRRQELDREKYTELFFGKKESESGRYGAGFEQALQQAEETFAKSGQNYLLAAFDLDHYRALKEAFGEKSADRIMQTLERLIDASERESIRHGRVGEGRIMVLYPNSELMSGSQWRQGILRSFREHSFLTRGERLRTSVTAVLLERKRVPSLADLRQGLNRELYDRKLRGGK
jgi:GGDEF domain-containing protein